MRIRKLKKQTSSKEAVEYLRKKHNQYFAAKVMDEGQIESNKLIMIELVDKLKLGLGRSEM